MEEICLIMNLKKWEIYMIIKELKNIIKIIVKLNFNILLVK